MYTRLNHTFICIKSILRSECLNSNNWCFGGHTSSEYYFTILLARIGGRRVRFSFSQTISVSGNWEFLGKSSWLTWLSIDRNCCNICFLSQNLKTSYCIGAAMDQKGRRAGQALRMTEPLNHAALNWVSDTISLNIQGKVIITCLACRYIFWATDATLRTLPIW